MCHRRVTLPCSVQIDAACSVWLLSAAYRNRAMRHALHGVGKKSNMLYQKRYVKEMEYRTLYYGLVTIIGYITTFAFSVGLTHALCGSPLWCPSQHTQFP